ncbi:hypothetical protein L9F63_026133, partial [Diploptera punctata]
SFESYFDSNKHEAQYSDIEIKSRVYKMLEMCPPAVKQALYRFFQFPNKSSRTRRADSKLMSSRTSGWQSEMRTRRERCLT